ncbi:hypothetical protein HAX54_018623 [Datura stramonium]|uniref:Uncharacterized protein n=1 Tax=Datura stramonium TaxID=4076 RepID=A0ABS8UMS1_DATST|nr:hypothetical protein [Datura stramonium]
MRRRWCWRLCFKPDQNDGSVVLEVKNQGAKLGLCNSIGSSNSPIFYDDFMVGKASREGNAKIGFSGDNGDEDEFLSDNDFDDRSNVKEMSYEALGKSLFLVFVGVPHKNKKVDQGLNYTESSLNYRGGCAERLFAPLDECMHDGSGANFKIR